MQLVTEPVQYKLCMPRILSSKECQGHQCRQKYKLYLCTSLRKNIYWSSDYDKRTLNPHWSTTRTNMVYRSSLCYWEHMFHGHTMGSQRMMINWYSAAECWREMFMDFCNTPSEWDDNKIPVSFSSYSVYFFSFPGLRNVSDGDSDTLSW